MEKIRLFFHAATEIADAPDIGLLVLMDADSRRQLAIPCEHRQLAAFEDRVARHLDTSARLPEVMWKVIAWETDLRLQVIISGLEDGHYNILLTVADDSLSLPIEPADAIMLSYVSEGYVPIYVDSDLFARQSTPYDSKSPGIALPVNAITMPMLRAALERAIKDENYEMAAHLRDEINRRTAHKQ